MSTRRRDLDARTLGALGVIAAEVFARRGGAESWTALKRDARAFVARDPIDAVAVTALAGTYLFYLAEKGKNPKVESFWDALVFVTTCMSVGYADTFARTPSGKAIAAWVMTVGPSLAAGLFAPPAAEVAAQEESRAETQKQILARLDAILAALQASGEAKTTGTEAG
jgi:hypothetical protein